MATEAVKAIQEHAMAAVCSTVPPICWMGMQKHASSVVRLETVLTAEPASSMRATPEHSSILEAFRSSGNDLLYV